mmetsp:Transcript_26472/g.54657  ORF Transcript_26472/g.54657 Transcript_26472/m.54657 type:complete len:81 (-) Transcript_26472:525-767(-)
MRSNTSADSILNHWENPGVAGSQELRIQPGTTTMSMSSCSTPSCCCRCDQKLPGQLPSQVLHSRTERNEVRNTSPNRCQP